MKDIKINRNNNKPASRWLRSNHEFNNFIIDTFHSKYRFDNQDSNLVYCKDYFEKHLFFITMHFNTGQFAARDKTSAYNTQPLFNAFRLWYIEMLKKVVPRDDRKTKKQQPFALAYFDVEGTAWKSAPRDFQIPHIHATLLLHPNSRNDYAEYLMSNEASLFRKNPISKIEILPFQDDGRGIEPMLTYAGKFARAEAMNERFDWLFERYPDIPKEAYPFYR